MTTHPASIRHLDGPAGRLEARIDEPAGPPRAVAVVAPPHPELGGTLHDRVVYHATQGLTRVGCAVVRFTFRGAGASEGTFTGGPGEREDFRAAIDVAAARYPELPMWAVGYSFGSWIAARRRRRRSARHAARRHRPADDSYDFAAAHDRRQAGLPRFTASSITSPRPRRCSASTARSPSRESWSSSTAPITCSTATSREIADTIVDLLSEYEEASAMPEAVIVAAVRTPVGKAPNGALRHTRPDDLAAAAITAALARVPALDAAEVEDVILGCAMPEGEQGLNVARIASLRAGVPAQRVGRHHQPVLRLGPAVDRLRRRADPERRAPTSSSPAAPSR